MSGARLRTGEATDSPLVTDFDYCLLAVQRRETVIEASGTAPDLLGTQWEEVMEAFNEQEGAALAAFRKLQRTIYGSALIARDRDALLAGYLLEFDKAAKVYGKPKEAENLTRGASGDDDPLSALSKISQLYGPLSKRGAVKLSDEETKDLRSGASAWARAAGLRIELAKAHKTAGTVADTIMRAQTG